MAFYRGDASGISVISLCLVLLCDLSFSSVSSQSSLVDEPDYYSTNFNGVDDRISLVPLRSKRYVGEAIQRLAENYPSSHGKSDSKDDDIKLRGKKMEMIGNLAVPVSSVPSIPAHIDHEQDPIMTSSTSTPAPTERTSGLSEYNKGVSHPEDGILSTDNISRGNSSATQQNNTLTEEDDHKYYKTTVLTSNAMDYWVNMSKDAHVLTHGVLSDSYRRAEVVKLSFGFPFYGHVLKNVTVATGGFIYTGDFIHSWLATTQYIAPLMANFDTRISPASKVMIRDNGTALTVEWSNVFLQDKSSSGGFYFQVTLHQNGDIVFVYKAVPVAVIDINGTGHPVKVGLSDAYVKDNTVFMTKRKIIYEYHRVTLTGESIGNGTAVYISALPTCLDLKNCTSCLTEKINFSCLWCRKLNRCSSGFDRYRQDWLNSYCPSQSVSVSEQCNPSVVPPQTIDTQPTSSQQSSVQKMSEMASHTTFQVASSSSHSHTTGMLGLFIVLAFMSVLGLTFLYAYRNPLTPMGQLLIKYRPRNWPFRRNEVRYTAATIHM